MPQIRLDQLIAQEVSEKQFFHYQVCFSGYFFELHTVDKPTKNVEDREFLPHIYIFYYCLHGCWQMNKLNCKY